MIKTVIVEDELKSRDMLAAMIRKITPELEIVGLAGNVSEAEKLIRELKPELVFLDISMRFALLSSAPAIIF